MFKGLFNFFSLFFLLGAALLLFFSNLNGAAESSVLGRFYWLEVDTSGLQGFPQQTTRWTLYGTCGVANGKNSDCTKTKAAFPFSPVDNTGNSSDLPSDFVENRDTYYYLTRISYAFLLVGVSFTVFAILSSVVLPCIGIYFVTPLLTFIALLFTITAAACLTAAYVKGRNQFNNAGHTAKLGRLSFGLLWASVACLILSFVGSIFACCAGLASRRKSQPVYDPETYDKDNFSDSSYRHVVDEHTYVNDENDVQADAAAPTTTAPDTSAGTFKFFRVNRKKNEEFET
ncbi:endocytosis/sphingolipid biosynthesis/sporulation effector [Scheffersomyces amazonensis]|uniref:endocytosis/sphingolipid biosynthesis/sporulation effector n=1 Tax=Scheffersomyces amazonensis TaxID=1078765 RepID=UPI00315D40D6